VQDFPRKDPVGMIEHQRAQILILHTHYPAGLRHARELTDDDGAVRDVQQNRHREGTVEPVRRQRETSAVAYAEIDARVEPAISRQTPRGGDEHATGIDSHDAAARADGGGNVAGEDTGAGTHLQHTPPLPDTAEAQEAPA